MRPGEMVVQYAVTTLILLGVGFFVFKQMRNRGHSEAPVLEESEIGLTKVRHVENGQSSWFGKADESNGGKMVLGHSGLRLQWMLGTRETEIAYSSIEELRVDRFGLTRILVLRVRNEDRFWAIWTGRSRVPALIAFLETKGVRMGSGSP